MNLTEAAILGLVQGLTEFLPISSSGHLVIAQKLLGFHEAPVTFDIYLHLATLAAVIFFFRKNLKHLNGKMAVILIVATIPAIILGLALKPFLEVLFNSWLLTSAGFFISALIIFLIDRIKAGNASLTDLTPKKSFLIGIYQAVAIIPSISRSGAAIYAGLKLGLNRETAVTFAFLISIPAILGAVAFDWITLDTRTPLLLLPTLVGMLVAFIVGFFSLYLLKKLVLNSRLFYFGWYCLFMAVITLIWSLRAIM